MRGSARPTRRCGCLDRLSAKYPDRADPYIQKGDLLAGEKKYTEAVEAYDQAVALTPHPGRSDWFLFYARGAAYRAVA